MPWLRRKLCKKQWYGGGGVRERSLAAVLVLRLGIPKCGLFGIAWCARLDRSALLIGSSAEEERDRV